MVAIQAPAPAIQAHAPAAGKRKRQRRRQPSIPPELRKETVQHVRAMARKYRTAFESDADLKNRVLRLERALLPPRPRRRGRPRDPETTRAIALYRRFRRKHPGERADEIWDRVCRELYSQYPGLDDLEQKNMRYDLLARVKSRSRCRRVQKSR
jgi:hypothetical protein